jgi:antitoxin (DNA-binding transcriptional repressor) of toxin-antitoxin stability system
VALAKERALPLHPAVARLFPEGVLARGSVVACPGRGGNSVAMAVVGAASQAGSWIGVVGLATFGLAAAAEMGVAVERVVAVPTVPAAQWATVLAAVADGVDVVITTAGRVSPADARRLQARLVAKGAVLVVVDHPGSFSADVTCRLAEARWEGLEAGCGRLVARRATLESTARRNPQARRVEVWLPGPTGGLSAPVEPVNGQDGLNGRDVPVAPDESSFVSRAG